jgi:hypothetical protein
LAHQYVLEEMKNKENEEEELLISLDDQKKLAVYPEQLRDSIVEEDYEA